MSRPRHIGNGPIKKAGNRRLNLFMKHQAIFAIPGIKKSSVERLKTFNLTLGMRRFDLPTIPIPIGTRYLNKYLSVK